MNWKKNYQNFDKNKEKKFYFIVGSKFCQKKVRMSKDYVKEELVMEMLENGGYDNKKLNENVDKLIRHEL